MSNDSSPCCGGVRGFLRNRWVTWISSLTLGCFFILASYHKIADPPDFAKAIYNYCIFPGPVLSLSTIYVPWFELLAGIAVAVGIARRGAAFGLGMLCMVFIAALSYNLLRGHPTICGCFGKFADGESWTREEKFFKMWREVALDAGLVLLSLQILYATHVRPQPAETE